MSLNIASISAMSAQAYIDPEHQRIMRELRALGIEPTGDKSADKAKLEEAKAAKKAAQTQSTSGVQFVTGTEESSKADAVSSKDEAAPAISAQTMTGAEQIAQLNKFKLLGIY